MQDRFYFGTNTKMFKTAAETVVTCAASRSSRAASRRSARSAS